MSRKSISLKTKLAAALLTMKRDDGNGNLVPVIPHEHAKEMTADQVLSLFQWDHFPIPHAHGGTDHHSNLEPRLIAEHRTKTAKIDRPMMAKVDRIQAWDAPREPSRIQSRNDLRPKKRQNSASRPLDRWSPPHAR